MELQLDEQGILRTLMDWRSRVSAAAWMVVRDTHAAEDIFQNVVLKAMTRDVRFESEAALVSWASITARREGIDWLRKHRRETLCFDERILQLLEDEWQADRPGAVACRIDALRECIESLPQNGRRLLRLRYFDGLGCDEVAQAMGAGLNAIYKRLSRMHESLRHCVEGRMKDISD